MNLHPNRKQYSGPIDRYIDTYTLMSLEDVNFYNILNFYSVNKEHEQFETLHNYWGNIKLEEFETFLLKPERKSLKFKKFYEFIDGKEKDVVAYECRLGSRERSIIIAFKNKADAMLFKLSMESDV